MSDQKRTYRMKRRAELEQRTRQRITESAVELHGSVGPAAYLGHRRRRPCRGPALDRLPALPRRGGALRRVQRALGGGQPAARPRPLGGDRGSAGAARERARRAVRVLPLDRADDGQPAARRKHHGGRREPVPPLPRISGVRTGPALPAAGLRARGRGPRSGTRWRSPPGARSPASSSSTIPRRYGSCAGSSSARSTGLRVATPPPRGQARTRFAGWRGVSTAAPVRPYWP